MKPQGSRYKLASPHGAMRRPRYVEGRNIVYELRYAGKRFAVRASIMQRRLALAGGLIMSGGTPGARAGPRRDANIPIVPSGCPTRSVVGLAASNGAPGGNVTGSPREVRARSSWRAHRDTQDIMARLPPHRPVTQSDNPGGVVPRRRLRRRRRAWFSRTVFEARQAEDVERVSRRWARRRVRRRRGG